MKQFKQLAALFLAFALVVGMFSQPTVAYAADSVTLTKTDLASSAVLVDYENERLQVTKTASDTIYYTVKWAAASHAKTAWEEAYEQSDTKAYIDFSNLSAAKDASMWLTTDKEKEPIEVKISAQENALNVAFSGVANTTAASKFKVLNDWTDLTAETAGYKSFTSKNPDEPWPYGYLVVTIGKGTAAKVVTASEAALYLEFRKGTTGAWSDVTELDVRKYVAYGAQLSFRLKAVNNATTVTGSALAKLGRTSKEVKVKYAKQANAPKISINGVTKEIKLAKTQEYRVYTTSGSTINYQSWVKVADKHMDGTKVKKVYLKDLLESTSGSAWSYNENNAGQGVQVRVAASDKGAASKIGTEKLNQATTPTAGTGSAVVVQFGLPKSTTYDKGITVKNTNGTTGAAIQVAVVSGSSVDANAKTVKWVKVAPGKTATISGTLLKTNDTIIYRTDTIKNDTKTAKNEFVVSSDYGVFDYKTKLPLAEQTFEITEAKATSTVTTASPSATLVATAGAFTVSVTNTASPAAITVALAVTTKNVVAGTPKVECVKEATASSGSDTASKVKLAADGSFTETAGKLKILITADAGTETKIFRVTLDGKVTYVTVTFTK